MLKLKRVILTSVLLLSLVSGLFCFTPNALAWFGAGRTPGLAPIDSGLNGQIALPDYKFSPDFYEVGYTLTMPVDVINDTDSDITFSPQVEWRHVWESPTGTNVMDGTPTTPGINENDLYTHWTNGQQISNQVQLSNISPITVPARQTIQLTSTFTFPEPGYYHFRFSDPNSQVQPTLATGFVRALNAPGPTPTPTATPTPTPTPTATPVPTATPTPSPTPSTEGKKTNLETTALSCSNQNFDAKLRLTENGSVRSDVKIVLNYAGSKVERTTNAAGEVQVGFSFSRGSILEVRPEQGFPGHDREIIFTENCPSSNNTNSGDVLGATTLGTKTTRRTNSGEGEVLGASTLAATGVTGDVIMQVTGSVGAALTLTGSVLYGRKR